jgi:hypothetical protein
MRTRTPLLCFALLFLSYTRDASAYTLANDIWFDATFNTLNGYVYTSKDWWDPDSGYEWVDSCECYYYWEDYVSVIGKVWRPSGPLYGQGYIDDFSHAQLDISPFMPPENGLWTQTGNHYLETDWYDNFGSFLYTDTQSLDFTSQSTSVLWCGDERGNIIAEYPSYGVSFTPTCSDFSSSGGTEHFSWSELNGGFSTGNPHNPWGIVRPSLTTGLEATRSNYNRGGIRLTSGYRCPHGNANVSGVQNSYHVHGRAADLYSSDHAWTEEEFALLKAAAIATSPGPIEALDWNTYADHHFHAAW